MFGGFVRIDMNGKQRLFQGRDQKEQVAQDAQREFHLLK